MVPQGSKASIPASQRPHFTGDGHAKPILKEVGQTSLWTCRGWISVSWGNRRTGFWGPPLWTEGLPDGFQPCREEHAASISGCENNASLFHGSLCERFIPLPPTDSFFSKCSRVFGFSDPDRHATHHPILECCHRLFSTMPTKGRWHLSHPNLVKYCEFNWQDHTRHDPSLFKAKHISTASFAVAI